jgi:hypothetical protein
VSRDRLGGPMRRHSAFRPAPRDWRSLAFALIVLCSTPAHAQIGGTISGYVHDQAGGVMPGVTVTAESAGQQLLRSAESNATGFFDLQAHLRRQSRNRRLRDPGSQGRRGHGRRERAPGFLAARRRSRRECDRPTWPFSATSTSGPACACNCAASSSTPSIR